MADSLTVDIEKRFRGGATIAAALDVSFEAGSILVLFGPSGAGKTTVLRCLAGLERPDRGTIRFRGDTWFDAGRARSLDPQQRRVGCVFQEPLLFPHLTARANVEFGLVGRPAGERGRRGQEMLALVGMTDLASRYPRELSGGQAQRVAVARAVAPEPALLLLDEPWASLDAPTVRQLRGELRGVIRRAGIPAVLVTHDRTDAIALGDEIAVLVEGRVRQAGPIAEVFRRPTDLAVARALGVESLVPARIIGSGDGLLELRVGTATLRAVDADLDLREPDLVACIRAEDVTLLRQSTAGSARNHFAARVVALDAEGPVERVSLDCGFPLVALITRQAREEMALAEGSAVVAAVKATSVHLVRRD
jgi:molybdate transport system ATP-binding protein